METEHFDAVVIGSGNGGMYLAWHMAESGLRTAVVERRWIGGSCPNINCLPSKNEIWSAKVADMVRHAGILCADEDSVPVDMVKVRERKRAMVTAMVEATLKQYENSGAELIMGRGRFVAPRTISVRLNDGGRRMLTADRVFLNLGTRAAIPAVPGLRAARPMTSIEALERDYVPPHLIVLGGGHVGLELAQAYRRFGSRVTIIQHGPHVLSGEDDDVAAEVRRMLVDEGINVVEGVETAGVVGRSGDEVSVVIRTPDGERLVDGTDLLVATGRIPNTARIGLDIAGVELDENGYVLVNDRLETTAPDVWGIGECCSNHPQFTHASFDDFRILRDNFAGGDRATSDRLMPFCMFTDPELARVGWTEKDAAERGVDVRVARLEAAAVLRTQTTGETRGFMKALIAKDDDRILGFTMFGAQAGEVLAAVQMAMTAGVPYTAVRDAVLAHPTMAEGLNTLFANVPP
ncbi:mercuric reductase [Mycolicibacterium agri]|uniref:Mercuric reductase n=1 Tax=Mycolicibacterium agri TaxID=36811 RepID=A0A2A7MNG5_MYCAG|nr:FAD-dependent oxidoreductase [Mycolicibacterium agri]PEG33342.1 mercuric reductase [Mycolicibacterium agri]GFG50861.1 mercuric reductase [Mycolicibacterium agri]